MKQQNKNRIQILNNTAIYYDNYSEDNDFHHPMKSQNVSNTSYREKGSRLILVQH